MSRTRHKPRPAANRPVAARASHSGAVRAVVGARSPARAAVPSPARRTPRGARFAGLPLAPGTVAAGLVALGVALRLWLIARGWPALDSDEAIMGLMARHILTLGERPVFFYGQHYLGVPDAYLVAGFFALLGQTTFALHLTMLALTGVFLALAYALGRAAYGPAVGLLTLAFLALGPAFGLLREMGAIGGYQVTLLLGALLCLLVYAELRRPEPGALGARARLWACVRYALIGLVAGLGIWTDLLIVPFVVVALLALAAGRSRVWHAPRMPRMPRLWGWLALAALSLGLALGALPLLAYNIQTHGGTLAELARQNRSAGQRGFLPAPGDWLAQTGATLAVGLPALLGSPRVCVARGGIWPSYPPALAASGAGMSIACGGLNALFALAVLACYTLVAWQVARAVRNWWRAHPDMPLVVWAARLVPALRVAGEPTDSTITGASGERPSIPPLDCERAARLWLRAMLLLAAAGTIFLYTVSNTALIYQFTAARYLLPLYVTLPLVFGVLWTVARPVLMWGWQVAARRGSAGATRRSGNGGRHAAIRRASAGRPNDIGARRQGYGTLASTGNASRARGIMAALAALLLAVLLGFSAYGGIATVAYAGDGSRFALPAPSQDRQLLATLRAQHITRFVSDYWTCYRLAFESGEQVRCAVRDGVNNTLTTNGAVNRYAPYLALIERTPHPAYIFAAGSAWDSGVAAWATAQHLPYAGYVRLVSAGYAIYYDPAGQG